MGSLYLSLLGFSPNGLSDKNLIDGADAVRSIPAAKTFDAIHSGLRGDGLL